MSNTCRLGEIRRVGDIVEVTFHRRYARPIAKVWAALATPERISDWFANTTINRMEVGGQIALDFKDENYRAVGEIVIYTPMQTFAWTWSELDGSDTTLVRWDLEPDGDGCKVTLTHSGLTPSQGADVGPGWHAHLQAIEDAADGRQTQWSTVRKRADEAKPLYAAWTPPA